MGISNVVLIHGYLHIMCIIYAYKVELSSLEHFLSLNGALLHVDGHREDGMGA